MNYEVSTRGRISGSTNVRHLSNVRQLRYLSVIAHVRVSRTRVSHFPLHLDGALYSLLATSYLFPLPPFSLGER